MSNIADIIESYILQQLAAGQGGQVEIRRDRLAEEMSCAPSQISYVLSTRFTPARGFNVESRRGLGGFIRITGAPARTLIFEDMIGKIENGCDLAALESMIFYLLKNGLATKREARLLAAAGKTAFETMDAPERISLLKSLFMTLAEG